MEVLLPPLAPCDWSLRVSVRGEGGSARPISMCLDVNLALRLRSRL